MTSTILMGWKKEEMGAISTIPCLMVFFSIQPFNGGDCELMYEEYGEGRKDCFGEDADSNEEDNSGNEYPDEEDSSDGDGSYGGYCDEDGLTSGVRGLGLGYSSGDEPNSESDAEDELVFTRS